MRSPGIAMVMLAALLCACASRKDAAPKSEPSPSAESSPTAPLASIQIDYARAGDSLQSVTVTEYTGAHMVAAGRGPDTQASVMRFDGGVPIWEIRASRGIVAGMLSRGTLYAVKQIKYGVTPDGFEQVRPDLGDATPLAPDHFYVFTVTRASGSTNFQAIKVGTDGALQVYDAEPRAGTSFRLCCNLSSDFASSDSSPTGDSSQPLP